MKNTLSRNVLWLMSTLTALVLLFGYRTSTGASLAAESSQVTPVSGSTSPSTDTQSTDTQSSDSSSGSTDTQSTTPADPTPSTDSSSSSADGTFTGDVAQTRWGPVQVEITVSGGSITDVTVLQYPTGERQDAEINNYALPILIQETLDAQSSNVDMVSGATVTSEGYTESLQSALDQAGL